ncbi:hypothetical protein ACJX0J_026392 [Zea mays]
MCCVVVVVYANLGHMCTYFKGALSSAFPCDCGIYIEVKIQTGKYKKLHAVRVELKYGDITTGREIIWAQRRRLTAWFSDFGILPESMIGSNYNNKQHMKFK